MKRIVNAFIVALVVGWAFLAEAHDVEVVLYPTIGPVSVAPYPISIFPGSSLPVFLPSRPTFLTACREAGGTMGAASW
jgi:hypothetical protein